MNPHGVCYLAVNKGVPANWGVYRKGGFIHQFTSTMATEVTDGSSATEEINRRHRHRGGAPGGRVPPTADQLLERWADGEVTLSLARKRPGNPEPDDVAPPRGIVPVAVRGTEEPRSVEPGTAPQDAL